VRKGMINHQIMERPNSGRRRGERYPCEEDLLSETLTGDG